MVAGGASPSTRTLWAAGVDIVGIANFVTFLERTGALAPRLREAEYGSLEHAPRRSSSGSRRSTRSTGSWRR